MFPLSAVLFPRASMPLHIFEPRYRALMRDCLEGDARFGVVLIERGSEVGGGDQRAQLGTRGTIVRALELADGRWAVVVRGDVVVRIAQWLPDDPYPMALVDQVEETPKRAAAKGDLEATVNRVRRVRALLAEHGGAAPLAPEVTLDGGGDPAAACWEICAAAPVSAYDAQRLLGAPDVTERLAMVGGLMEALELDLQRLSGGT
jgi:Lon protease-like protein